MTEEPDEERLRRLEARIAERKAPTPAPDRAQSAGWSQGEVAWRMVIELVSGLVLGLAIGYGLDWLFGTRPILLLVFCLLGFAAGIRTVLGTAREMAAKHDADVAAGRVLLVTAARNDGPQGGEDERD